VTLKTGGTARVAVLVVADLGLVEVVAAESALSAS